MPLAMAAGALDENGRDVMRQRRVEACHSLVFVDFNEILSHCFLLA
jgi:hypothetical protein